MSNLLFIDTETTGVFSDKNEVIEIACRYYQDGCLNGIFHGNMVTSGTKDICLSALKINKHKYGNKSYEDRETVAIEFVNFLTNLPSSKEQPITIAGHNIAFDIQMLKEFLKKYKVVGWEKIFSYSVVDTSTIANFLREAGVLNMDRMGLDKLGKALGVEADYLQLHKAETDVKLTADCYFKMVKIIKDIKFNNDNYESLMTIKD